MSENERSRQPIGGLLVAGALFIILPVATLAAFGLLYSRSANAQDDYRSVLKTANGLTTRVAQNQSITSDIDRHLTAAEEFSSVRRRNGGPEVSLVQIRNRRRSNPEVNKFVQRIQKLGTDQAEPRNKQIEELRELLNQEFAQMHQEQGEEIARTQERLDALKRVHKQREDRKDEIVQRRINDLLGEPDELAWIAQSDVTPRRLADSRFPAVIANSNRTRRESGLRFPSRQPSVTPAPPRAPAQPSRAARPSRAAPRVEPVRPAGLDGVRIDIPASIGTESLLKDVFQLARSAANAISESKVLEAKRDKLERLHEKGVSSQEEFQRSVQRQQQLAQQEQLYRQQIKALHSRLVNEAKFAADVLENAAKNVEVQSTRFDSGTIREEVLLEVQRAKLQAQKRVSDVQHIIDQFKRVMSGIENIESAFDTESFSFESFQDEEIEEREPETSNEEVEEVVEEESDRDEADEDE